MFPLGSDGGNRLPSLSLDFTGGLLDSRITASGGANGTRFNSAGTLVAATTPRFDYTPSTLAARGVLIEEARTNLITNSATFDNAAWVKNNSSLATASWTSPDGTLTGETLAEDASALSHYIAASSVSYTAGQPYTFSVYAKDNGGTQRWLALRATAGGVFAAAVGTTFNLRTGAVATNTSGNPVIESLGGGVYRCSITVTPTSSAPGIPFGIGLANTAVMPATVIAYAGDGVSNLLIWGAKVEAGAATSYTATTAAAVTRTVDALSMTGANFTSWYTASQGTFVCSFDVNSLAPAGLNSGVLEVSDGTANNAIRILVNPSGSVVLSVISGGVQTAVLTTGTVTPGATVKVAVAYAVNDYAMSVNGAAAVTTGAGALPVGVNQLAIGNIALGQMLNGHSKSNKYFTVRQPNAALQSLST